MKYLIMFFVCISGMEMYGQFITGKVSDKKTGDALIGAIIQWENSNVGTVTDAAGDFKLPAGETYPRIIISYVGYNADTITYTNQTIISSALEEATTGPTITVIGHKQATAITMLDPQNFQILNEKELCKAACCNLSESFETNASIDASFADAITGTKQIRMLGLDGRYTQIMFDNIPAVRGLASTYGLTYVPGPFINSIQIAKGVGSVAQGFESMTGQINVAYKNPDTAPALHLNAYAGSGGRLELNAIWNPAGDVHKDHDHSSGHSAEESHEGHNHDGEDHEGHDHADHEGHEDHDHHDHGDEHSHTHFHPVFMAHGAMSTMRWDMNGDGFLDNPLFRNLILRNEWHLETDKGLGGQYAVSYTHLNNVSGTLDYSPTDEVRSQLWGVNITTDRYDFSGKTGYVFKDKPWKSFGSQVSASWHDQRGNYGFRQYTGQQTSARVNLLFASRIKNDSHKFTTGISYLYDDYRERIFYKEIPPVNLSSFNLDRLESVPGAFVEYTFNYDERLIIVSGARADLHNTYGLLFTPRIHTRYSLSETSTIKLAVGKGFRTANVLMDNVGMLASNRDIVINGNNQNGIFGLEMEEAWNTGLILSKKMKLFHRDASISVDAYRTAFVNQVVMDMETPGVVEFYNLKGSSYSNSLQVETQWSPIRRVEWRLAYRWLEVRTDYNAGRLDKPLVNRHRAFTNLAYETKEKANGAQWRFDATLQWISKKRIPMAGVGHEGHSIPNGSTYSNDYVQLNAQVTYVFKKNLELYVGGENLTNFMVHDPIFSAENPNSESFDGSLIWGPVFGRMGYVGIRWTIE